MLYSSVIAQGTNCRDPRKRKLKLPPSHPDYRKPGKTASPPQPSTIRSANLPKHTPLGEKSAETRIQPSGTGSAAAAGQVGVDSKSRWNYKSRACTFYATSGKCRRGDTCNYYHDEAERRLPFTYGEAPPPPPPPPPVLGSLEIDTTARPQTPPPEQPNSLSNPHNASAQLPNAMQVQGKCCTHGCLPQGVLMHLLCSSRGPSQSQLPC